MRKCPLFSVLLFVLLTSSMSYAGFNILKQVQDKVEKKVEHEVDKSIDQGMDQAEGALKGENRVYFGDKINQKPPKTIPHVVIKPDCVSVEGFSGTNLEKRAHAFWGHIAISFNTRALKVYFGESKPVDSNSTPEGKPNNRRVQFVKG